MFLHYQFVMEAMVPQTLTASQQVEDLCKNDHKTFQLLMFQHFQSAMVATVLQTLTANQQEEDYTK